MKKILITGGAGGLGKALSEKLIKSGHFIAIHYNKDKKTAQMLKNKFPDKCEIFQAGLTKYSECVNLVKKVINKIGHIDILINNAGAVYGAKPFLELNEKDFEKTLSINFKSAFFISQKTIKYMIEKNIQGRIINISSISAKYGGGLSTLHYGCAKAALECFTKGIAKQYAENNILVNCVQLGFIDTEFHKKIKRDIADIKERIKKIPVKRAGTPKEVADFIEYLCSDKASFITGQIFTISGGD